MSICLRETANVRSRKARRCSLCDEHIPAEQPHYVRVGVSDGDLSTMRMHVECRAYEQKGHFDQDWYECGHGEPAFPRGEALAYAARKEGILPQPTDKRVFASLTLDALSDASFEAKEGGAS